MRKVRVGAVVGLLALSTLLPARAEAQFLDGTFTGGSNFATTVSATLTWLGNGIVQLDITNFGPGVFAAIGLSNAPAGTVGVSSPAGWSWGAPQIQNPGDWPAEIDGTVYAYRAPNPRPSRGLQPDGLTTLSFRFDVGDDATVYENIGFAVHAIAFDECSTKFAVWDGGASSNDNPEGYDPSCGVSVPEPSSMLLLATGMVGFAWVRRRRGLDLVDQNGNDLDA